MMRTVGPLRRHSEWREGRPEGGGDGWVVAGTVAICVAAVAAAALSEEGWFIALSALAFIEVLLRFGPRASRRVKAAIDLEAGDVPVRASYLRASGVTLGTDHGALALVDGWLVFRGARTDWSVRRDEVEPQDAVGDLYLGFYDGPVRSYIVITPLGGWGRGGGKALRKIVFDWKSGARGESVFPPQTAAPEVWRARNLPWGTHSGRIHLVLTAALVVGSILRLRTVFATDQDVRERIILLFALGLSGLVFFGVTAAVRRARALGPYRPPES